MITEFVSRSVDDLADGRAIEHNQALARGLSNGCEQSQSCHGGERSQCGCGVNSRPDAARFECRGKRTDSMTEILMVRHGQSEWNAQGRWQGQADPPLSALGLEQAEAGAAHLAKMHAEIPFDGIASSTLVRASTTGDVIARHLGFDEPYRTANLVERSAGEWSGLTRDEIEASYPGYLRARRYPTSYEYDDALYPRIQQGLRDVIDNVAGDRLIVAAHGGIIYCIEQSVGLQFRHMPNLGARWFDFDDGKFTLGDRVELLVDFQGESTTPSQI